MPANRISVGQTVKLVLTGSRTGKNGLCEAYVEWPPGFDRLSDRRPDEGGEPAVGHSGDRAA